MKRFIACIVCIGIVAFVSCSYENTATVTIDTGIRHQAQLGWFDRVLAFFSLAQPLQADPPIDLFFDELEINVTALDMDVISLRFNYDQIVNNNGRINLDVPAGNQRTFEVVALAGSTFPERYYGGIATVDLSPGEHVALEIEIGKLCVPVFTQIDTTSPLIQFDSNDNTFPSLQKVELWESTPTFDKSYLIQSIVWPFTDRTITFESSLIKNGYHYIVKTYNKYGYWMSDYQNPNP
ncbi:MAG: hypothetical protein GYA16_07175 [Spirochaetes bacterium]|nr:hypothetical protein [Spirochaetota bacterium]